jgi:MFS family permease
VSSRRDASSGGGEQRALQPRYRRAFGCVTWVYMATLAFLAVASFGLMPIWFVFGWNVFSFLEGIAFFATLLILPAMVFGAALGLRTYRSRRRDATRNGAAIGAIVGWTGFAFLAWLENVASDEASFLYWLAVPPALVAAVLALYALFDGKAEMRRRRRLVLAAALLVGAIGVALLVADFAPLLVVVALVSTLAGAAGGWTAGVGHARAGGDDMMPPGTVRRSPPK